MFHLICRQKKVSRQMRRMRDASMKTSSSCQNRRPQMNDCGRDFVLVPFGNTSNIAGILMPNVRWGISHNIFSLGLERGDLSLAMRFRASGGSAD